MTPLYATIIAVVVIVVVCRTLVTIERIKGVSQNAGDAEKYSKPAPPWHGPTTPSDGMSQP